ncbi:hypothetical protein ASA1KI_27830 [Opitutales bacterium ASA1]|uniref:hypothetical protein n=1 Tax=Congregicoccus parvus TaxID=3081749 RepID=UPI002B2F0D7C|nr:hypothetical protein ASA1KI_27830 [Opitutales bacterium ASA1]
MRRFLRVLVIVLACSSDARTVTSSTDNVRACAEPIEERLTAYAERMELLRAGVEATGRVSYADVVAAAYAPGMLTAELSAMKLSARSVAEEGRGFGDYERRNVQVSVDFLEFIPGRTPGSRFWGQYNYVLHRMQVDRTAHTNVIVHESGHILQRDALLERRAQARKAGARPEARDRLGEAAKEGLITATRSERLRYLVREDEFEVRLQDLNRFFAVCVAGRPIATAQDALDALMALGIEPTEDELKEALALAGERAVAVARGAEAPRAWEAAARELFDDAYELVEVFRWSRRAGKGLWPEQLARILREAPLHF